MGSVHIKNIEFVDLLAQHQRYKDKLLNHFKAVIDKSNFIGGHPVREFESKFQDFFEVAHCIGCGNGTDAIQLALMALDLKRGDEVIVPAFTYFATVEPVMLLGLKPVLVDASAETCNLDEGKIEEVITSKTKAIIVAHLFGQSAAMEEIMDIAKRHNLYVIEDCAQALGSSYTFSDGTTRYTGCIGDIGTTSFFPTKNLGGLGDGGAVYTDNPKLAARIRMLANHGQISKYEHKLVGINSRLDALQAGLLTVKLDYLESDLNRRKEIALLYYQYLEKVNGLNLPGKQRGADHTFNQFTIHTDNRNMLKSALEARNIPSMIYYEKPIHFQEAMAFLKHKKSDFPIAEQLADKVLSIPVHPALDDISVQYISGMITSFYGNCN